MSERRLSPAGLSAHFDESFAAARITAPTLADVLAIEIAGHAYALRLAEIAGVFVDRPITKLPSRRPAVIGLVGFRNTFAPVFDLATLLGHAAGGAAPRWLVIAAYAPIAFAFAGFAGHLRVPAEAFITGDSGSEMVRDGERLRSLVTLATLQGGS